MVDYYINFYTKDKKIYFEHLLDNSGGGGYLSDMPLDPKKVKETSKYLLSKMVPNLEITLQNRRKSEALSSAVPIPSSDFTTICDIIEREFPKLKFNRTTNP